MLQGTMFTSMRKGILYIVFILLSFNFGFAAANAASLYLDPPSGVYGEGNTFSVKVRADTQEECINALNVTLSYPQNVIRAVDVARGESILTLWTEDPEINHDNGTVHFSGGLPGGYCGRIEGDPGFTNVVAEIIFQVPGLTIGGGDETNAGTIAFAPDTQVLLNDGFGTQAQLFVTDSTFIIGPPTGDGVSNEWFDVIRNDDIRPEAFGIELLRDESVYGGKWFIIFSALDKQSGLDHYEVYETDIDREGYIRGTKKDEVSRWKEGKSPYLLEDQTLGSIIRVRAIDKAGNERLAGKIPEESLRTTTKEPVNKNLFYTGVGVLLLFVIVLFVHFLRKRRGLNRATIETTEAFDPSSPDRAEEGEQTEGTNNEQGESNI